VKRLLSVISAVLVAAVVSATAAPASADPLQSVTGSGWRGNLVHPTTPLIHFVVSAQSGPLGVSGIYDLSTPTISNPPGVFNFKGDVTCLQIVGNQAIVGGVVTSGGEPGQIGTGFAVGFIDTGPATDTQTFTDLEIPTPVDCTAEQFLFTQTLFPVLNGNVVVAGGP
jgi:hypothetical protein